MLRRVRYCGFTAVELLVVIGIIMVLAGLSISAIQRVRGTANRIHCANNLRQVGLALHAYHGSHGAFPAGCDVQDGEAPYPLLGWAAHLLPYIDQEPLWRSTDQAFKQSSFIGDNPPHIGLNTVLPVYTCPADERTFYPQKTPPTGIQVALSSYLGVAGTDFETEDGMLFTDSAVQLSEVTDGASNTLLVGERPQSTICGLAGGTAARAKIREALATRSWVSKRKMLLSSLRQPVRAGRMNSRQALLPISATCSTFGVCTQEAPISCWSTLQCISSRTRRHPLCPPWPRGRAAKLHRYLELSTARRR